MSKHDDAKPGELTPQDLRDALRVNRALEHAAQADIDYRDRRVAKELGLIEQAQLRIAEHHEDAQTAPERLKRIRAKIAEQEKELAKLEHPVRSTARTAKVDSKHDRIVALTARISAGDMTAVAELQRLVSA